MMKYEAMTPQQRLVFNDFHRYPNHWRPDELLARAYTCHCRVCCGADRCYLEGDIRVAFDHCFHQAQSSGQFSEVIAVTSDESVALLGIFKPEKLSGWKSYTSLFHLHPREALVGEWMLEPVLGPAQTPSYENRLAELRGRHIKLFPVRFVFGLLFVFGIAILLSVDSKHLDSPLNQMWLAVGLILIVVSAIVGYSARRRRLLLYADEFQNPADQRTGSRQGV